MGRSWTLNRCYSDVEYEQSRRRGSGKKICVFAQNIVTRKNSKSFRKLLRAEFITFHSDKLKGNYHQCSRNTQLFQWIFFRGEWPLKYQYCPHSPSVESGTFHSPFTWKWNIPLVSMKSDQLPDEGLYVKQVFCCWTNKTRPWEKRVHSTHKLTAAKKVSFINISWASSLDFYLLFSDWLKTIWHAGRGRSRKGGLRDEIVLMTSHFLHFILLYFAKYTPEAYTRDIRKVVRVQTWTNNRLWNRDIDKCHQNDFLFKTLVSICIFCMRCGHYVSVWWPFHNQFSCKSCCIKKTTHRPFAFEERVWLNRY